MSGIVPQSCRNRRTVRRLVLVVIAMFGFGYALVPLYDLFCEVTGLGGRTGVVQAGLLPFQGDENRLVTLQLHGTVNSALHWDFHPVVREMKVHPGRLYEARYVVRNRSGQPTVGQAVPRVTPADVSGYLNKAWCFCFEEQHFEPGETREMSVRFVVSEQLPRRIEAMTLSYIFFDAER